MRSSLAISVLPNPEFPSDAYARQADLRLHREGYKSMDRKKYI
jgi:hypothetical protein